MSDPTDPGGVGAQAERGRTSTRVGDSGSPVGSPLTIVLALIAVVAGFLIFRSIDDSSAGGLPDGGTTVPTVAGADPNATTTVAGATVPTTAAAATGDSRVTTGATVIVANAANVSGAANRMQVEIAAAGYTVTEEATTDTNAEPLDASIVYYSAGPPEIQAVAQSVATDMGGLTVEAMPSSPPVEDANLNGATVLVMMGTDTVDQTLEDLQAGGGANVTAPDAQGSATTTG